ncbi:MAG: hypothetical protein HOV80_13300 [Polyangiaceae bacterium]|nr:hypothetical protein [Polyangiaceae bacterium]
MQTGFFWTVALLASLTACDGRDENGKLTEPREAQVLTGRLDVVLTSTSDAIPIAEAGGSLALPDPTGRMSLVVSAPTWVMTQLLVGACDGACGDPESQAWLEARNDAIYGTEFWCDPKTSCIDVPEDFGASSLVYGSCPDGFVHKAQPIRDDLVDFTDATPCLPPPTLEEGKSYYVHASGHACDNSDFNDCDEIRGVRFFRIEDGAIVDLGGNTDARHRVYHE